MHPTMFATPSRSWKIAGQMTMSGASYPTARDTIAVQRCRNGLGRRRGFRKDADPQSARSREADAKSEALERKRAVHVSRPEQLAAAQNTATPAPSRPHT